MPLDAPSCPVAAHRPPDAPNLSIGQGDGELSIQGARPGQQALVRAAQRQLAERREQGTVAPRCRGGEARLRQDMEDDRRFRLGRLGDESFQWPDRIYQARQQEKRPCLQTNRMPAFVALALNAVIGANLRPSVQPVDDKADVKTAEVLSALIRNTEHISQVEAVYAAAIDSMAENGRGYVQINMNILLARLPR